MATKPNPFKRFEFGKKDNEVKGAGKEGSKKEVALDKKQMTKLKCGGPAKKKC